MKIIIVFLLSFSLSFGFDSFDDFDESFLMEFEQELSEKSVYDPFEKFNRQVTKFNDKVYTYLLNPVAKSYKFVTPQEFRDRTKDFFNNLLFPVRLVNNLLQGKIDGAVVETGRFFINSTFGVLGLFDAATVHGIEERYEDFGTTLAHYGVGSGPYLVLPLLGPSNMRDFPSIFVDYMFSPLSASNQLGYSLTNSSKELLSYNVLRGVNGYSYYVDNYELTKTADQYVFFRDMYQNSRDRVIKY